VTVASANGEDEKQIVGHTPGHALLANVFYNQKKHKNEVPTCNLTVERFVSFFFICSQAFAMISLAPSLECRPT
jgi:hypothetical protein